jgi:hypothetical protein
MCYRVNFEDRVLKFTYGEPSLAERARKWPRCGTRGRFKHRARHVQGYYAPLRRGLHYDTRPNRFSRHGCTRRVRATRSRPNDIRRWHVHQKHGKFAGHPPGETFMLFRQ